MRAPPFFRLATDYVENLIKSKVDSERMMKISVNQGTLAILSIGLFLLVLGILVKNFGAMVIALIIIIYASLNWIVIRRAERR